MSRFLDLLALVVVIAVAAIFFRVQEPDFGRLSYLGNMIDQRTDLIILSVAMTFVLLVGEIDLSVGSLLALASVLYASVLGATGSVTLGVLAALGSGAMCGAINGLLTVGLRIPSFVVTLGMMEIARGLASFVSEARRVNIEGSLSWLNEPSGALALLPLLRTMALSPSVPIALGIALLGHLALRKTVFGRHCQAIGDNARAFELSGGRVGWRKVTVFALAGLAAGLAGLMQTARLDTSDPTGGIAFELVVIAAVVVGGTSLAGGRASIVGTLLGCLLIAVLQAGLSLMGTGDVAKRISTGSVILFAVLLDAWRRRRAPGH